MAKDIEDLSNIRNKFHPPSSNSTPLPSLYAHQTVAFILFTLHCHIISNLIIYLP